MAGRADRRAAAASPLAPSDAVFAPVRSQTAFEETVDRLGTAIKLGLLAPGSRLPAERELCARLGHRALDAAPGADRARARAATCSRRAGAAAGTFVADPLPPAEPPSRADAGAVARDLRPAPRRRARASRCSPPSAPSRPSSTRSTRSPRRSRQRSRTSPSYRQADVRLHVGLAEATHSASLVRAMTEVQGAMTDLIAHIAHPPEVLASSNAQHRRLLAAVRERDAMRAVGAMSDHLQGTEHVLAGLLPGGLIEAWYRRRGFLRSRNV